MTVRPRVFEFAVSVDPAWDATGDRGGTTLRGAEREEWTPEHLVLAGLVRCVLTSFGHHARRSELVVSESSGTARGAVTRRESDGRHAFVTVEAELQVTLAPRPDPEALAELLARAERDCFIGASLTAVPVYRWTIEEPAA